MISRNSDATLVALIDVKPKESLNLEQYEVPFFNSIERFLESDVKTDVVTISTPNGFHASQAIKALEKKNYPPGFHGPNRRVFRAPAGDGTSLERGGRASSRSEPCDGADLYGPRRDLHVCH